MYGVDGLLCLLFACCIHHTAPKKRNTISQDKHNLKRTKGVWGVGETGYVSGGDA